MNTTKGNLHFHESKIGMSSNCFTEIEGPHSCNQKLHIAIALCIDVYVLKYCQPQTLKLGSILRCFFVLSHRGNNIIWLLIFDFILFVLKKIYELLSWVRPLDMSQIWTPFDVKNVYLCIKHIKKRNCMFMFMYIWNNTKRWLPSQ